MSKITCEKKFGCEHNPSSCIKKAGFQECVTDARSLDLHTICAIQAIFCLGQKGYPITEENIVNCGTILTPSLTIDPNQMHKALEKGVRNGLFRAVPCAGSLIYEVCPGSVTLNPALSKYADFIRMFNTCRAVYPDVQL